MYKHTPRLRRGQLAAMTPEARKAYLAEQANRYYNARYKKRFPKRDDGLKVCRKCKDIKPETEEFFRPNPRLKRGLGSYCRKCETAAHRENRVRKEYGMTRAEYDQCFENARCAVCSTDVWLVMDHCHSSGVPRGILCNACNTGIGLFKDEPHRLEMAAAYLREFAKE